ncbi:MAG: ATP-dependent nuclease [Clostridia bacterium]
MKVKSVKIQNFKSFAEENNRIDLDNINTIVGKNESGKSNLIQAIGKLDLTGINDINYFKNNNKNNMKKPLISLVLVPYKSEKNIYKSIKETVITIYDQYDIDIDGGLTEIISNDKSFQKTREKMNELNKNIYFSDENKRKQFSNIIKMINNAESKVFINYTYIDNIISSLESNSTYDDFTQCLKECREYLMKFHAIFPQFILLDDIELKTKYTRKYLEDNTQSKQMLKYLLKIIGIDFESLMGYWKLSKDDDKYNFVEEMNSKIEIIIREFNKFYKQEDVKLKVNFDIDSLNFVVKTNNKYLNLSERSNGLKWYLNMYIQLLAKTQKYDIENYVVLLDEPGVYLHVNAQKEILNLFEDFTSKDNQIIYTTQLPTMIYQNDLYRTRTIIKDDLGNSNIGNRYYSLPHKMSSKKETITPILTAIGMNMGYSFTSMDSKKVNIITEGISDYNYLKAFLMQKQYKKEYNIIPSCGVDNIHNIISILIGWGYKYKILIDQDKEGRKQYKILINKLLVDLNDIKFVDGTNKENDNINFSIENLFSEEDRNNIGINNEDYSDEKAYYSLELLKKVENNEYRYSDETINNFDKIIKKWLN